MFRVHFVHFDNTKEREGKKVGIQIGITMHSTKEWSTQQALVVTYNDAKRSRDARIYSKL